MIRLLTDRVASLREERRAVADGGRADGAAVATRGVDDEGMLTYPRRDTVRSKMRIDAPGETVAVAEWAASLPRRMPIPPDRTSICVDARTCRLQGRFDDVERQTIVP